MNNLATKTNGDYDQKILALNIEIANDSYILSQNEGEIELLHTAVLEDEKLINRETPGITKADKRLAFHDGALEELDKISAFRKNSEVFLSKLTKLVELDNRENNRDYQKEMQCRVAHINKTFELYAGVLKSKLARHGYSFNAKTIID